MQSRIRNSRWRLENKNFRQRLTSLYGHVAQDDASSLVVRMVSCIEHVNTWMTSNRLWLNPSKTELIWLGSSRRLHYCPADKVRISDSDIQPAESVRDLGVLIDSAMTLTTHVNHLVGVCFFHLRQIRIVRRSLSTDAAHSLVRARSVFSSSNASTGWLPGTSPTTASRCQYRTLAPPCVQPDFRSVFSSYLMVFLGTDWKLSFFPNLTHHISWFSCTFIIFSFSSKFHPLFAVRANVIFY